MLKMSVRIPENASANCILFILPPDCVASLVLTSGIEHDTVLCGRSTKVSRSPPRDTWLRCRLVRHEACGLRCRVERVLYEVVRFARLRVDVRCGEAGRLTEHDRSAEWVGGAS